MLDSPSPVQQKNRCIARHRIPLRSDLLRDKRTRVRLNQHVPENSMNVIGHAIFVVAVMVLRDLKYACDHLPFGFHLVGCIYEAQFPGTANEQPNAQPGNWVLAPFQRYGSRRTGIVAFVRIDPIATQSRASAPFRWRSVFRRGAASGRFIQLHFSQQSYNVRMGMLLHQFPQRAQVLDQFVPIARLSRINKHGGLVDGQCAE